MSVRSIVLVQDEYGGTWMHETITRHGSDDHHSRSHKIRVTTMECLIIRTKRHVKTIPIMAEEHLRNEISKTNLLQTADKFNELMDHFVKLDEHKHSKKYESSESNIQKHPCHGTSIDTIL